MQQKPREDTYTYKRTTRNKKQQKARSRTEAAT